MSGATKPAGAREAVPPPARNPRPMTGVDMTTVQLIPMELLHRSPYQVRREGDVSELAADIQAHGLINPITVRRRSAGDGFEVVAGHRRWAAMRSVEPEAEVPCIVLDVDDRTAEELLVAENFVRADLSIMEQAETVALLTEHGRTAEECGRVCRRSVRWAHRMRAIGGIGEPWRGFLHAAGLPYSCALAVARLPECVREEAWLNYWRDVACDLCRDGEDEVGAKLAGVAADWPKLKEALVAADSTADAEEYDFSTDRDARLLLQFGGADRMSDDRFELDGPAFEPALRRFRALSSAPFPCEGCKGCVKRSDAQPELFDDTGTGRVVVRCLDPSCWKRHAAAHVEAAIKTAKARGVTKVVYPRPFSPWMYSDTLDEALEKAGGNVDAVRVRVEREEKGSDPTGRVCYDVVAEEKPASVKAPTVKREPWEEWRPENPRWMPTLFGDKIAAAWFCVGLLVGRSYEADADDENAEYWRLRPWCNLSVDDVGALLARCGFVKGLDLRRADFLVAKAATLAPTDADHDAIRAAWRTWLEARKHLPEAEADE